MERKKQTLIAVPLLILVLISAAVFYVKVIQVRRDYNAIVTDLVNQEKHAEAAEALESLLPRTTGDLREDAVRTLAEEHRLAGTEPGVAFDQSVEHFRRARELDPDGMEPQQLRALESAEAKAAGL